MSSSWEARHLAAYDLEIVVEGLFLPFYSTILILRLTMVFLTAYVIIKDIWRDTSSFMRAFLLAERHLERMT